MADTYLGMVDRIADELARSDLTTEIQQAIAQAIREVEHNHFWFNEQRVTFSTVISQEIYDMATYTPPAANAASTTGTPLTFDAVSVNIGGYNRPMIPTPYPVLDQWQSSGSTHTGYPTRYAVQRQSYRLYPIPIGVFTVAISGVRRLWIPDENSVTPDDTSEWFDPDYGERLVRTTAKRILYADVIDDDRNAAKMQAEAGGFLQEMLQRSNGLLATGTLPRYYW